MAVPRNRSFKVEVLAGSASDLAVLDALARLVVAARTLGLELRLAQAPVEFLELVALAGLAEALGLQLQGEPEERKQPLGIEEEGQFGHAAG
jgi:gamma-glutamyl:cysteine ligase YbdK (ATP-grasp superfamily)